MTGASDILNKLQKVDILLSAQATMQLTEETAMELQAEQLSSGKDRYDSPITNYNTGSSDYSPSYAVYKGRKRPIDLKDTGDYHQGLKLDVQGETFEIASTDWKDEMLEDTYKPLGLGVKAKNKWIKIMQPIFKKLMSEQLL